MLRAGGYHVESVESPAAALELFGSLPRPPDLLLTDLRRQRTHPERATLYNLPHDARHDARVPWDEDGRYETVGDEGGSDLA